jgi:hypothetical protein
LYRHFDAVIRNNHTYLADSKGILTIPLGYANATTTSDHPAALRRYSWSFVGQMKASRLAMVAAFQPIEPALMVKTPGLGDVSGRRINKNEYNAILADSIFAPCPMGNALLDTFRLYESLELGCIPLVEKRLGIDYFGNLLGPNPIPAFRSWQEAAKFVGTAITDSQGLRALQHEIANWWGAKKRDVCIQLQAICTTSHASELQYYGNLVRNRHRLIHEPLRVAELLRHQSSDSLRRRLMRPTGPVSRIFRENIFHPLMKHR